MSKDYSDNTVIVSNLLGAGVIYVHFRQQLTEPQLAKLKDIAGITEVSMMDARYGVRITLTRHTSALGLAVPEHSGSMSWPRRSCWSSSTLSVSA